MRDMQCQSILVLLCMISYMTNGHELNPMGEVPHDHFNKSENGSDHGKVDTNGAWNESSEVPVTNQETTAVYVHECAADSYQPEEPQCNNWTYTSNYRAYTCDGRCDDPIINIREGLFCSCHQFCLISNDCCKDFQTFCWESYKIGEQIKQKLEASVSFVRPDCWQLFADSQTKPYWIVTRCPIHYSNPDIKFNCEGPPTEFTKIVPVTSKVTGLSYKNHFCAQCNNITDFYPWVLNVTCNGLWEGSIDSPQSLLEFTTHGDCKVLYMPHIEHHCVLNSEEVAIVYPSCHGNILGCSRKHVHLCENGFQMPVNYRLFGMTGFKNIHCLICMLGFLPELTDLNCEIYTLPGELGSTDLGKFSFGILVDFDLAGGGTNVGFDFKHYSKVFGCKSNSELAECVSYCLDGYEYIEGKCVFRYQPFPMEVYGKWYSPGLLEYLESFRNFQFTTISDPKGDIETFLSDMLHEAFIVEDILIHFSTSDVDNWDDADQTVHFSCHANYKLKGGNTLSKGVIHSNLFNIFVKHVKHYNGRPILNLLTMCFKLFQRESCWYYGRINHYGNDLYGNDSSNTVNSTEMTTPEILNITDCLRKSLNSTSLEFLSNGSIFIIKTETVIPPDQFKLVANTVYVCVNESEYAEKLEVVWRFDNTMGLLTIICSALSLACLATRLALQPMVPLYQNFPGKLQCSLVLALFKAGAFFLIGPNCSHIKSLCIALGVLIHWSYLAAFSWTVIIARDMFILFGPSSFSRSSDRGLCVFIVYSVLGWGIPGIVVTIAIGLDFSNIDPLYRPMYGTGGLCWITQRYPLMIFFMLPIAITIIINIGFFIPTAITLWKSMTKRAKTTKSKQDYPVRIYAKLFCLMGFTWIFAFIAPYNVAFWYIFIVLNSSQGVYIFLAFVLTKKVWISLTSKGTLHGGAPKTSSTTASGNTRQNQV